MRRTIFLAAMLPAFVVLAAPSAAAHDCPPYWPHCDLVIIDVGDGNVTATTNVSSDAGLAADGLASVTVNGTGEVVVGLTLTGPANATVNATVTVDHVPGVLWTGGLTQVRGLEPGVPVEVIFPFALMPNWTVGDVVFVPVTLTAAGSEATTYAPFRVLDASAAIETVSLLESRWLNLLGGISVGAIGTGALLRLRRSPPSPPLG